MTIPLDDILSQVRRPSRYLGGEVNARCKSWEGAEVRWCLAFPDVYEIGMGNLGLGILYHILNDVPWALADRVYAPWRDMEAVLREKGLNLWGLESRRPLKEFDIIGISVPYELTCTNIITILELGGIPVLASERSDNDPLVVGGGACTFNPEPVAPFFDAVVLGDGEEAVVRISEEMRGTRDEGRGTRDEGGRNSQSAIEVCERSKRLRKEMLETLSKIDGVYVPSLPPPVGGIKKATIKNLDNAPFPTAPVVPFKATVQNSMHVEIQRGCAHGCRFCQAGYTYRPVRRRSPEKVVEYVRFAVSSTGMEDLSFLSLSASDYPGLDRLIFGVVHHPSSLVPRYNISLPSLRVEGLTDELLASLPGLPRGGFTFAPEAGTERMRAIINKQNSESDLANAIETIFAKGFKRVKLYFMIGLPYETDEDVEAIATLSLKAHLLAKRHTNHPTIVVNVSTFVPKPFTPFQWAPQISLAETIRRQGIIKKVLGRRPGIELKFHSPKMSVLEGVFSRGDRRLAAVILKAHELGCKFDAWDDELKFEKWLDVFRECGIDYEGYLTERPLDAVLPWGHLYVDLSRELLKREYGKATDCGLRIANCGLAPLPQPSPLRGEGKGEGKIHNPQFAIRDNLSHSRASTVVNSQTTVRFTFTKLGPAKWLSHLELMDVLRRAFRRAGIGVKYSQGFHPHMRLSLKRALKVGQESNCEEASIELVCEMEPALMMEKVNETLPEGVRILEAC